LCPYSKVEMEFEYGLVLKIGKINVGTQFIVSVCCIREVFYEDNNRVFE